MFNWSEVGMFFAGGLFGTWFWWKEIINGLRYKEMGKQQVRNQLAVLTDRIRRET